MLIAYDGSEESCRAMTCAAHLLKPRHVEILTVWEPVHRQAARAVGVSGLRQAEWSPTGEDTDPAYREARDMCRQGVELAESLGLLPRAHLVECATSVWSAIVDAAQELQVDLIVSGTRAQTGFRSFWQTSTSENVINNGGIPVFVVPPAVVPSSTEHPEN
ncbi:universal stress protein [Corynebacterium poyangense]|uniref:Universal stress protein n=1 Tax=Corynebacterium poyangense TaxID=2684405 RepID=A0A7H0SS27_9CORY|nr:universal stress protein [Corynebacterium poyangense]MBZ8177490.1 universal stress protein [Corynebacterium poyangense]QNQ91352.1 universal stress protein [Corynebacterium poyangense]